MNGKYIPTRTNRTPWTDVIRLISVSSAKDSANYEVKTESSRDVFCTFSSGISRTEFYESMKAGIVLSAEAEIWQDDYGGETLCEVDSRRYKIVRVFETGRGTLSMSLSEVIR